MLRLVYGNDVAPPRGNVHAVTFALLTGNHGERIVVRRPPANDAVAPGSTVFAR
jgi:hypothetical protein